MYIESSFITMTNDLLRLSYKSNDVPGDEWKVYIVRSSP